jgi:hypothetical protein
MPSCRSILVPALVALAVTGCQDQEQIQQYTVAKSEALNERIETPSADAEHAARTLSPARTLGAIVPHAGQTWYFKLTGPDAAVAAQEAAFREFLETVKFSGGEPAWTLPEGWRDRESAGGSMGFERFATVVVPAEDASLELTVIPLKTPEGDLEDDLLRNINRWRDQLALPPLAKSDLADEAERLTIGGEAGTLVNIAGQAGQAGGMSRAPFAGSGREPGLAHPPIPPAGQPDQPAGDSLPIAFEAPETWKPGRSGGLRLASFEATNGGETAEITVIVLAPQELRPNVDRWRGQVGLEPASQAQFDKDVRPVEVDGADGHLVEVFGPEEAILGAILDHGGQSWIFKLQGPVRLAEQERERFEAFVRSVKFK